MTKERKNELLLYLETEIQKALENAKKTDEASKFIMTGLSQAGDKYHAQNAADLAQTYVNRLQKLKKEIQEASGELVHEIKPACYVEVEFDDTSRLNFYLVENAVSLTKYLFISKGSPLGSSVQGKKEGEPFKYELEEGGKSKTFSGRVVKVE